MRTVLMIGALTACLTAGAPKPAEAANFWGQRIFRTHVDVSSCAAAAVIGIRNATGTDGIQFKLDNDTITIRGFTATGSIFVDCTGSPVLFGGCGDDRPTANASVIAFSSSSSTEAATLRDKLVAAISNAPAVGC
jgi:hypothetical protein